MGLLAGVAIIGWIPVELCLWAWRLASRETLYYDGTARTDDTELVPFNLGILDIRKITDIDVQNWMTYEKN